MALSQYPIEWRPNRQKRGSLQEKERGIVDKWHFIFIYLDLSTSTDIFSELRLKKRKKKHGVQCSWFDGIYILYEYKFYHSAICLWFDAEFVVDLY